MIIKKNFKNLVAIMWLFSNQSFAALDAACQKDCADRGNEINYCKKTCSYNPVSNNASNEGYTPEAKWDDLNKQLKINKELKLPNQEFKSPSQ